MIINLNPEYMRLLISLALCCFATTVANAQSHKEESRHGGIVEESNGYHFEMVRSGSQLTIYVLEAVEKPSLQYTGIEAEFIFGKKPSEKAFLVKSDRGYFVTTIPSSAGFDYCMLVMEIEGERLSVTFPNSSHSKKRKHGHSH